MLPQLQGMPLVNQLSQVASSTLMHMHDLAKPFLDGVRSLVA